MPPTDNDQIIHPTGTCFTDAMELLNEVALHNPDALDHYTLVHAICIAPTVGNDGSVAPGELFAHAWLEKVTATGRVEAWQKGVLEGYEVVYAVDVAELEQLLKPQRTWKYSPRMALECNRRSHMLGPWEPELAALCGRRRCRTADVDA